ncbi:hypothetical protein BGX29_003401, partial [Mortierella sp. GBA35]
IITYTPSVSGNPYFNSFDTVTGTWSGPGVLNNDGGTDPESRKTPIVAIIGGVVGGLVVLAILVFLFVRRRRRGQQKSTEDTDLVQHMDSPDGSKSGEPAQVQVQYYDPYEQQYQDTSYVHPPPPPPINAHAAMSFEAYQPAYKQEVTTESSVSVDDSPYVIPTSYRDSPTMATDSPSIGAKTRTVSNEGSTPLSPQLYTQNQGSNIRSPQTLSKLHN